MAKCDACGKMSLVPEKFGDETSSHWGQTPLNTDKENKPGLKVL